MALHWRPVGPEAASTYWQRRAVLAVGAVLLLVLLVTLLTGGSDEPDTLAGAPSPAPSLAPAAPSPVATAPASPLPAAACAPEALKVEALADAEAYDVGARPKLSLRVTNTGPAPCSRDLGPAAVELLVSSGKDRIWSSDDCAKGGGAAVVTLEPGRPEVQRVTWNGRRSLPGCAGEKAQAQAGTYRVSGRVGEQRVEGQVFRLAG